MLRRQGGETIRFKYGLCFFRASVFFPRTVRYLQHLPCGHGYLGTISWISTIQYPRCWGGTMEGCRSLGDCPWCGPSNIRHLATALQSPPATPVTSSHLHPLTSWRTRHQWPHRPPPDSLGRVCVNAKLGAPGRRHGRETRAEVPRVM